MFEQTKALCRHFLDMGIPGFDLIVYKDGECVLRHMGGYADPENKIPQLTEDKIRQDYCDANKGTTLAQVRLRFMGAFEDVY